MGSPLSPVLSEIFMDHFENNLFKSGNKLIKDVFFWYRYVDDIICLYTGSERQLDMFLNFLNSFNSAIKFTIGKENNAQINFLDITITRTKTSLDFKIFRKPTYTDIVIPAKSNHPNNIKMAAFNSYAHRLLNVPMSVENYNLEV